MRPGAVGPDMGYPRCMSENRSRFPTGCSRGTRLVLGIVGALLLVAAVNDAFALGWVGQYSRVVTAALSVIAFLLLHRAGAFHRPAETAIDEPETVRPKPRESAFKLSAAWGLAIGLALLLTVGPGISRGEQIPVGDVLIYVALVAAALWIWRRERTRQTK